MFIENELLEIDDYLLKSIFESENIRTIYIKLLPISIWMDM